MALFNKRLSELYRAVSGSARTSQAVSISGLAGGGSNISFSSFAFDSASATLPFTYIVENTTENVVFSFTDAGTRFNSKVKDISNNYTFSITPGDGAITFGTNANGNDGVKASTTKIGVTTISNGVYGGNTAYLLAASYQDGGWSANQDGFNRVFSKQIYNVDSYNSINSDLLCVDINTLILLSDGSEVSAEDLYIGDVIKTYVPTDMPDWLPENDTEDWYWWYQTGSSGEIVDAAITNIYYSFVDSYISINDDLLKCTHAHPLFINDSETNTYQFVRAEDITIGDKLIKYNKTTFEMEEIEVVNIETKNETLEIATITVDVAHTYLSNGFVSHNKGSNTGGAIPSANLACYLDAEKAASYSAQNQLVWHDLTGRATGFNVKPYYPLQFSGEGSGYPTFTNTTPKHLTFAGSTGNTAAKNDVNAPGTGVGISNFNLTDNGGAAVVWWQYGQASAFSNIFQVSDSTSGRTFSVRWYNSSANSATLQVRSPGAPSRYAPNDVLSNISTSWNMYAFSIVTGSGVQPAGNVYRDGTLVATVAMNLSDFQSVTATSAQISTTGSPGIRMAALLYYTRALSGTEVSNIYNNMRGRFGK
jgi:hypothetical protein